MKRSKIKPGRKLHFEMTDSCETVKGGYQSVRMIYDFISGHDFRKKKDTAVKFFCLLVCLLFTYFVSLCAPPIKFHYCHYIGERGDIKIAKIANILKLSTRQVDSDKRGRICSNRK